VLEDVAAGVQGNGSPALSHRERAVLELASRGMTNREIASELGLSMHAVKLHLASIYRKLGVDNRTAAAALFPGSDDRRLAEREAMDIRLFFRVLGRYRRLVAVGCVVAVGLSFFAYFSVGTDGVKYRTPELWISESRLFVSQPGFRWGRSIPGAAVAAPGTASNPELAEAAAEDRLTRLAGIYASLATSDEVALRVIPRARFSGRRILAEQELDATDDPLPVIRVSGVAPTREEAAGLADQAAAALRRYLSSRQRANDVLPRERVELQTLNRANPRTAKLFEPRSKTQPVFVFLTVMTATIGLALILESLRPQARIGGHESPVPTMQAVEEPRRTVS
jgi:DNA-binding CsgD family transcriptional regulator